MRLTLIIFLAACVVQSAAAFADSQAWDKVPQIDWTKVKLSDFRDDELDLPFFLAHFHDLADSVVQNGPTRGFIGLRNAWQTADFKPVDARVMENNLSLAYFYCTNRPWNVYYATPVIRQRLEAGLNYWLGLQNSDGRFAEYRAGEFNLAATAFASKFMGRTLLLLKDGPAVDADLLRRCAEADRKAIVATLQIPDMYETGKKYTNQFTCVFAGAAEYLALHPDPELFKLVESVFSRSTDDFQSPCGYFYEQYGADFGYTIFTHHRNQIVAYNYWRGTPLGDLIERQEARWVDWLSYNFVREPGGTSNVINACIESRGKLCEYWNIDSPMAEKVEMARVYAKSASELQETARSDRLELEKKWGQPWPALGEDEFTPYAFLMRDLFEWNPTPEQKNAATAKLPYLARQNFTHQRLDSRTPLLCTFIRRPGYYAIFDAGSKLSGQQRYGLGLVWRESLGSVLQCQPDSDSAAYGTRPRGEHAPIEAGEFTPDFKIAGRAITPLVGNHDLPTGDLVIHYPLGKTGEKTLSFSDDAITVNVKYPGEFTEQIPLLAPRGLINLQGGKAAVAYPKGIMTIEFDDAARSEVLDAKSEIAEKKLITLDLTSHDSLQYRISFAEAK